MNVDKLINKLFSPYCSDVVKCKRYKMGVAQVVSLECDRVSKATRSVDVPTD